MEYFYSQEKSSQIDFRKQLAFSLIYNNEIQQEVSPSKRRRKSAGCGEHVLMTLPCGMKFSGSKLVTAQTDYPQRKCATCKNMKCRTYCLCNPGEHLCRECYAVHRIVMADKWLSGILNLASKKFSRWGWFWPTISRWRSYERVNSKYRHLYSLTFSTRLNYARKTNS